MNDYAFGAYLYEKRKNAGLSQAALAEKLVVTNKAVSKWETGSAKPTVSMLRKLSVLFDAPVEELLAARQNTAVPSITKIVITGGPCAGKTTAMSWIQNAFSEKGYTVLFVPETATELITGGVAPWTCGTNVDYQKCQMALQCKKEELFTQAARTMPCEKVLIVCDRGMMDNKAYMSALDFSCVLQAIGSNEIAMRDSYDAVFHLVTAAKGAAAFYTTANNAARKETPAEAVSLDDKLLAAWTGHPHLRAIDNSSDFENKMKRLIGEIASFLGEPEPLEIERKYLIKFPDVAALEKLPNCRRVEIIQTYLTSPDGSEIRVRQRGINGNYVYYETIKRGVSDTTRVEIERRLTEREYLSRLMDADPAFRPIRKTRYCLTYKSQVFEIDVYPFWRDQAIAEIELAKEDSPITFPPEIKVIRDVTSDTQYRNSSLAKL